VPVRLITAQDLGAEAGDAKSPPKPGAG
jgi:hypothetical protein